MSYRETKFVIIKSVYKHALVSSLCNMPSLLRS